MVQKLPIHRLGELLPELKEGLIPADYDALLSIYNDAQTPEINNPVYREILQDMIGGLDCIADNHSFYKSNAESRELLKTAIGIIREL